MTQARIPFVTLTPGDDASTIREAIDRVLTRGWFILGPEVEAFEHEFAAACDASDAVGVGNGTDAISLLLRASGVGPGDEVIVPAMTAAYTALAVTAIGARPVIVDVEPATLTMDPTACEAAITPRTRALVPVHLYGHGANMPALSRIAATHGLALVEDCCQAHGATIGGRRVGLWGVGGAFSFYPTKNLGALGDGGAIVTNDTAVAARVRRLRNGGQTDRYHHVEAGINSRLDELQAAILRARLPRLEAATARRRALAATYARLLPPDTVRVGTQDPGHVYHLFVVRSERRDALRAHLQGAGIDTLIHYPVPLSDQEAFRPFDPPRCPEARIAAGQILSLPLHPRLADADIATVANAMTTFASGDRG